MFIKNKQISVVTALAVLLVSINLAIVPIKSYAQSYMVDEVSPVNYHVHTVSQRRAWGKGLMDEGLDLLVEDLFSNQNLLRLSATMVTNNRAVINFATRHGFKREGIVRDIIICNGEPRDVAYYGLTRKDYFNAKQVDPVMQE